MHAHCGALRTQMACPACPSGRASTSRSAAAAGWAAPSASTLLTRRVRRGPAPPLAAALAAAAATPWSRAEPNRVLAVAVDESDVSAFSREREREARSHSSLVLSCPLTLPPSQDAVRTFAWALDHLYRPGDTVHLLHVVPAPARAFTPPSGAIGYIPPPPASASADLEAAATHFLTDRLFPEARSRGLDPASMVRPTVVHECSTYRSSTEAVAATILRTATEIGAANLVMVSHHKARLQEALWGSVSKTVAAQARMPVTLVH